MKLKGYFITGVCCLAILIFLLCKTLPPEKTSAEVKQTEQTSEITGWQLLQMAIIMTESNFNYQAVEKSGDYGIMQITKVYVDEVNRILDTAYFRHEDAFNVQSSVDMFNIYQEYYNPEHDIAKAIRLHNPKGDSIGYEAKVLRNYLYLSRLEEIRNHITR